MIIILVSIILFFFALVINKSNRRTLSLVSFALFASILLLTNGQFEKIDYPHYINFYLGASSMYGSLDVNGGYDLEWPYAEFVKIIRAIFPRYAYIYVLCYGLMWLIPMYKLLSKGSNNIPLSLFLICTVLNNSQLLFIIAAQRQMIATVSIMWAYYFLVYSSFKRKKIIAALLLLLAIFAHSSSYFVIPLLVLLYFIKLPSKKITYIIVAISFIIGPLVQSYMGPLFSSLIISFGSADEIDRSTHYFIDNVYEFGGARYVGILPTTLIALLFTYLYDKKMLESYGAKCLLFAVTFYNIFNSVPLLGRSLNALFLLGVILGIPYIVSRKQRSVFRAVMCVVAAGLMYTTVRNYNLGTDTNGVFPYPYVWEDKKVL